jgi:S1-C subfamily serine protease
MRIQAFLLLMASTGLLSLGSVPDLQVEKPHQAASVSMTQWLRSHPCRHPIHYQLPNDFKRLLPSLVIVQNNAQLGTGVLISDEGYLLTAAHLVQNANQVAIYLSTGETVPGRVIGPRTSSSDATRPDIALVQIPGNYHQCLPLTNQPPTPGSPIFGIGFALANRSAGFRLREGTVDPYPASTEQNAPASQTDILQTTIDFEPGSSGGPLLNRQGEIVGIITGKIRLPNQRVYSFGSPVNAL